MFLPKRSNRELKRQLAREDLRRKKRAKKKDGPDSMPETTGKQFFSDIMTAALYTENSLLGLWGSSSLEDPVVFKAGEDGRWEPVWNEKYEDVKPITMRWVEDALNALSTQGPKTDSIVVSKNAYDEYYRRVQEAKVKIETDILFGAKA